MKFLLKTSLPYQLSFVVLGFVCVTSTSTRMYMYEQEHMGEYSCQWLDVFMLIDSWWWLCIKKYCEVPAKIEEEDSSTCKHIC